MALLPESITDPVAGAIFAHYKAKHSVEPSRPYLGGSAIGKSCSRALWYGFRWAKPAEFSGRLYRLFQTGHLQEPRINADLRAIGVTVFEVNPETGKQWSFSEPTSGGHFRGNADAILVGVPSAEKTPHLAEFKTSSDKGFKTMQRDGVEKSKPEHFFQCQIYMKWSIDQFGADGCHRALYLMVNKNTDEIYTERLEYRPEVAQALIDKANAIITSTEPPQGISTDSTYYECRFCDYHSLCHGQDVPQATCRSCCHATPEMTGDAVWTCAANGNNHIPEDYQREGCAGHRYIPILLARSAKPIDVQDGNVVYQMSSGGQFINGNPDIEPTHISSKEIYSVGQKSMLPVQANDAFIADMRANFDGRLVA